MAVGREEGEGKGWGVSGTLRVVQRGSREITTVHSTHVFYLRGQGQYPTRSILAVRLGTGVLMGVDTAFMLPSLHANVNTHERTGT